MHKQAPVCLMYLFSHVLTHPRYAQLKSQYGLLGCDTAFGGGDASIAAFGGICGITPLGGVGGITALGVLGLASFSKIIQHFIPSKSKND